MALFDRPYTTYYRTAIASIALFYSIFKLYVVFNSIVTLKSKLRDHTSHKVIANESSGTMCFWRFGSLVPPFLPIKMTWNSVVELWFAPRAKFSQNRSTDLLLVGKVVQKCQILTLLSSPIKVKFDTGSQL